MTAPEPLTGLSRLVSQILRHESWLYKLELDDEGWLAVEDLLGAIRVADVRWLDADRSMLEQMVAGSSKRRHEIIGQRIRALYGHSLPGRIRKVRDEAPPRWLFHGTSPIAAEEIAVGGLQPMGRQFVHLSTDRRIAAEVGQRKAPDAVVLSVNAAAATAAGVPFWIGNETVWLTDRVPARFVSFS